ncbi:MAG TPA: hypothetical protein VGM87_15745 [Roseomonas sp.]|jgi:hypothetical protein
MAGWAKGAMVLALAAIGALIWIAAAVAGSAHSPALGLVLIVGLFSIVAVTANARSRAGRGSAT